jgi:outer membrane scaffolding protein for murein synthesis (MipA/OmpV family)
MFTTIHKIYWRHDTDDERNNIAKINANNTAVLIAVYPTVFITLKPETSHVATRSGVKVKVF